MFIEKIPSTKEGFYEKSEHYGTREARLSKLLRLVDAFYGWLLVEKFLLFSLRKSYSKFKIIDKLHTVCE